MKINTNIVQNSITNNEQVKKAYSLNPQFLNIFNIEINVCTVTTDKK